MLTVKGDNDAVPLFLDVVGGGGHATVIFTERDNQEVRVFVTGPAPQLAAALRHVAQQVEDKAGPAPVDCEVVMPKAKVIPFRRPGEVAEGRAA